MAFFLPGTDNFNAFDAKHLFITKLDPSSRWLPNAGLYDALSAEGRALYWKQINDSLFKRGFDAWWLDTTEPETEGRETNIVVENKVAPIILMEKAG